MLMSPLTLVIQLLLFCKRMYVCTLQCSSHWPQSLFQFEFKLTKLKKRLKMQFFRHGSHISSPQQPLVDRDYFHHQRKCYRDSTRLDQVSVNYRLLGCYSPLQAVTGPLPITVNKFNGSTAMPICLSVRCDCFTLQRQS